MNEFIANSDGGNHKESITVQLTDESKTVQGNDPEHHRFLAIRNEIISILDKESYEVWEDEVNDSLWEKNELNSNNKTAYSMDEPFLVLQMEQSLNDDSINHYYHQFSIDMDGHLVLSADQGLEVEIDKDAPVIEMQVNDHILKQIKKLIEAHFWELEDFIYNPHFENQMDSITIRLTEDIITVKNNDPDEDHFITIRDELINLLDEEVRQEWEKEIKGYIREINANH